MWRQHLARSVGEMHIPDEHNESQSRRHCLVEGIGHEASPAISIFRSLGARVWWQHVARSFEEVRVLVLDMQNLK